MISLLDSFDSECTRRPFSNVERQTGLPERSATRCHEVPATRVRVVVMDRIGMPPICQELTIMDGILGRCF